MPAVNMLIFYLSLLSHTARELSENRGEQGEEDTDNRTLVVGDNNIDMRENYPSVLLNLKNPRNISETTENDSGPTGCLIMNVTKYKLIKFARSLPVT